MFSCLIMLTVSQVVQIKLIVMEQWWQNKITIHSRKRKTMFLLLMILLFPHLTVLLKCWRNAQHNRCKFLVLSNNPKPRDHKFAIMYGDNFNSKILLVQQKIRSDFNSRCSDYFYKGCSMKHTADKLFG